MRAAAGADAAVAKPTSATAAALREIELYRGLVEHFPGRKDQHAQAYLAIAAICKRIGLPDMEAFYAWKVTREFPARGDLLAQAYLQLAGVAGSSAAAAHEWTFALYEALDFAERGAIPAGHDAVPLACEALCRRICDEMQYDRFQPELARLERLAAKDPRVNAAIVSLLRYFGETELARSHAPHADDLGEGAPPAAPGSLAKLPGNRELEIRWEVFQREPERAGPSPSVDPAQVQNILDLSLEAGKDSYLRKSDSHYISYWAAARGTLGSLQQAGLAPLRQEQDKAAQPMVRALRDSDDRREFARLSRRYPYAASVHEALANLGEGALHQGRFEEAAGAFREVMGHSEDQALSAQARIGLCMALRAGAGNRHEIETLLATIPDTAEVPWRGARTQARAVKAALLAAAPGPDAAPNALADLPRVSLALPPDWPLTQRQGEGPAGSYGLHSPWPVLRIEKIAGACVVTGAGQAACFNAGTSAQRWQVSWPLSAAGGSAVAASQYMQHPWRPINRRPVGTSGSPSRAVSADGNIVYLLTDGSAVTAVDTRTGRTLWSTAAREEWRKLAPVNHPAASHGCVYVLALPTDVSTGPWSLVCLDGRDGSTVWRSAISWQTEGAVDLACGGSPVTIHGDDIYCCTAAGVLARCDARDGRVAWVRGYPSASGNLSSADALVYSREGSSPLVAGTRLFVAPRDSSGVMALSADTGELLWRASMVPSDRLLGASGNALITMSGQWLAALDAATGKGLWFRRFAEGAALKGAMVGSNVVVLSNRTLHLLAAGSGKTLEEKPLDAADNAEYAFLADGTLVAMTLPQLSDKPLVAAAITAPLALPLVQAGRIDCQRATVVVDRARSGAGNGFLIVSDNRALHVVAEPQFKIAWQRTLPLRPLSTNIVGGRIFFSTERRLTAFGLAGGAQEWTLELPFVPFAVGGSDKAVLAAPGRYGAGHVAAIAPAAGKLLWTRRLAEPARFRGGVSRIELLRKDGGAASLGVVLATLFDGGWQAGRSELDMATGAIIRIEPFTPPATDHIWFSGDALVYAGVDPAARIGPRGAAGSYQLPKPDAPGVHEILAHKIAGERLIVISGVTGWQGHAPGSPRPSYRPEQSRVYVDFFDCRSRQHVGRQTLDGVLYSTGGLSGYDTQAEILDRAIVVTDINGVRLFAARQ
ncbi:MAG: PQQ-binding-like beta-propeller repeat protein [Planctomycetaceae bacterium]|nr:PQQ-binding-like beta-propeller repeat protein [Planctomycetaceae bacterium]